MLPQHCRPVRVGHAIGANRQFAAQPAVQAQKPSALPMTRSCGPAWGHRRYVQPHRATAVQRRWSDGGPCAGLNHRHPVQPDIPRAGPATNWRSSDGFPASNPMGRVPAVGRPATAGSAISLPHSCHTTRAARPERSPPRPPSGQEVHCTRSPAWHSTNRSECCPPLRHPPRQATAAASRRATRALQPWFSYRGPAFSIWVTERRADVGPQ